MTTATWPTTAELGTASESHLETFRAAFRSGAIEREDPKGGENDAS